MVWSSADARELESAYERVRRLSDDTFAEKFDQLAAVLHEELPAEDQIDIAIAFKFSNNSIREVADPIINKSEIVEGYAGHDYKADVVLSIAPNSEPPVTYHQLRATVLESLALAIREAHNSTTFTISN